MTTIAFDIDGTWTTHPLFWSNFFWKAKQEGFQCIIVTGSEQPKDKLDRLFIPDDAVIIVSEKEFKEKAALKAGYQVDIWIDDMPGTIQETKILNDNLD